MERHKAIAIPVCFINGEPHFLIVHDKRFREWTFVTGGCRRREIFNPLQCALRELEEETRGVINITTGSYSYFKFSVKDSCDVMNVYHVYIIDFPMSLSDQERFINQFDMNKDLMDRNQIRFKKQYDEKMAQREKLGKEIEYMEMMLDRATRLISGLAGEKIRWEETVKVI